MLGKLVKYEFKATGRLILPLYAVLIGFAIITRMFTGGIDSNRVNPNFFSALPGLISMVGYFISMMAVVIGVFIITLQRFYKNLIGDEGYLMHTLPIKTWQNILNKLLVAMAWLIISWTVAIISLIIMTYNATAYGTLRETMQSVFREIGLNTGIGIEVIASIIISSAEKLMVFYASFALGQLFKSRKILGSFAGFLVISLLQSVTSKIFQRFTQNTALSSAIYNVGYTQKLSQQALTMDIVGNIIWFIILFFITNYIMSKKLNLE